MDIGLIKNEMRKVCKAAFSENNVNISENEIDEDIRLFLNFITYRSGFSLLDGISSDMMQALQSSLVDGIGKLTGLKSIATLFDAFAKKLLVMSRMKSYTEVSSKTMMPLFKDTRIILPVPIIDESTIGSYKGRSSGIYIFGVAYLTRNMVHNSPNWDVSEIVIRTRYVVALYIFIIHQLKSALIAHIPEIIQTKVYEYGDNKESQTAYDFISYSNPTNKIKNQVINSFISHLLYNDGMQKIDELISKIIDFSEGTITNNASQRLIQNLLSKKVLEYKDGGKTDIILSEKENERIKKLKDEYNDSLLLFHSEIDKLIDEYGLSSDKSESIKKLGTFFESNFSLDLLEADDQETDLTSLNFFQEFTAFIKEGGVDDVLSETIFTRLLEICRQNDIIIRISAGRVFSKMSNPDQFANYVRNLNRDVYLDTQILLYILCINDNYSIYDNVYFRVAKNIVDINSKKKRFNLKVSKHYISEIVFQIKQALFLIQFTELNNMPKCPISTNVFYRHYYWLANNCGLPEGVDTFRDYMNDMFELEEVDAFDKDFETIATGVVENLLYENFSIEIESTPRFENGLDEVQELYRQILKENQCDDKPYKTLLNDSLECMILFNQSKDIPEPFFLTWDKSFGYMRPAYKRKFKRGSSSLFFHLFSPAKFVNHVDLVDFKVNANTLSDDLLSVIESHNYKQTTYNVIDTINRFLDIPDISPEKRKAYIKKIQKEIYQDDSFSYEQSEIEQQESTNRKSFAFISQELFNHYKDKGQGYTRSYRNMLLDEASFEKFIGIISEYLNNEDPIPDINKVIEGVDELVNVFQIEQNNFSVGIP